MNRRLVLLTTLVIALLNMLTLTFNIRRAEAITQVNILSYSSFLDSIGFYHVVGEVRNVGDVSVRYVKIIATFYDSDNIVIATDFTYTELDVILPSRKSPFDVILSDEIQSVRVDHYSLSVTFSATSPKFVGLEILSNSSYIDSIGWMHIVGEIKNIGTVEATYVKVVATYYDETGTVVGAEFTFSDPYDLSVGQIAPFDILLSSERVPYVHGYEITAESNQYALVPEFSSLAILPLFMIATLLAVIVYKREHSL